MFNANNIARGFRTFTSIKTWSIQDKETFGEESITAQTILYRMATSEKLIADDEEIAILLSLNATVKFLADARVGAAEMVKNGEMSIAEFIKLTIELSESIRYHEELIAKRTKSDTLEDVRNKSIKSLAATTGTVEAVDGIYTYDQAIYKLKDAIAFFQVKSDIYLPVLNDSKQLLHDYQAGVYS